MHQIVIRTKNIGTIERILEEPPKFNLKTGELTYEDGDTFHIINREEWCSVADTNLNPPEKLSIEPEADEKGDTDG